MSPDEQPTIVTAPPNGSRPASVGWQAPSVEEMQAMLPQYEVIDILGRGGMGAVYKARQKSLKRLVAIKILPLGMADDEMKFVERFQNEAQTMAAMNHPAIVSVYDFGETANGLLYFIMEYVDGSDVHKLIQSSGKLSDEHALAITAHVCDALDYAHKRGVIHRDIKPANILIDQEGHIKVADFGLAKMDDPSQTSGLTKTNMAMGTPDYVAPEVLSPGMVADHRADLYAVGVMLYQMLTGEVPRGMFKLPSQKGIGSDPRFDEIICKAMEQDREERYQSAMDVRRDLDVILTTPQPKDEGKGIVSASQIPQKPVAKQPRPPGERSQPPAQQAPAQKAATAPKAKAPPKKQSPATLWLSIGGIITVLGVAGFVAFGGKSNLQLDSVGTAEANTAPAPKPQPPIKVNDNPETAVAASSSASGKSIDLLALVDVKRDAVAGEWSRDGGDLLVKAAKPDANGTARLQLPYQPPEEYDFEIEFTPESGTNMVGQALSAYQHSFSWFLDGKTNAGSKAGFDAIDGIGVASRTDGTTMRAKFLTNAQRHRSTIEVRRNRVRALLDGETLVTWGSSPKSYERLEISKNEKLRDALHLGLIAYDRAVRFHKITVREITGAGKVDAGVTSATPSSATPAGKTVDWLQTPPWNAPWLLKGGVLSTTNNSAMRALGTMTDGAVRVRVRATPANRLPGPTRPSLQVDLRNGPVAGSKNKTAQFLIQVYPDKRTCSLICTETSVSDGKKGAPEALWSAKPVSSSSATKDEIEWEFRAVGDELSAWADGVLIASVRDARVPSGSCTVLAETGIEITRLETSGITPDKTTEAKPDAPPNITNWQDVTESVREKARALPGLVVEPDGVRRPDDAPNATTQLSGAEVGDHAVRVRYVGQVQISLWFKGGAGSAYVLVVRDRTMFKRVSDTVGTEELRPTVPHPSWFDANQPHELLLTVQGPMMRVWLDNRFVGEAQEDAFKECSTALAFMISSTVQKVEIVELTDPAKDQAAQTFNGHRYQLVSGNLNWQEAKAEAEKLGGHLAVITSAEENDWAWKTFSSQLPQQPKESRWMRGWWLGASQTAAEQPWQWLSHDSMSFTHWGPSEPRATSNPPRYLWMADANKKEGTSNWSAQNGRLTGGCLVEWDSGG